MCLLVLLLLFLSASPAAAQDLRERYDYHVQWGYSDVARVTLQRGCLHEGYVPASLTAKSLGVIDQLHGFHIKLDSFADANGRALEGRTFVEEDGVGRRFRTRFSANGESVTHKNFRNKESTLRLTLRPGTHDLLSWFFALRGTNLSADSSHAFFVWDGWKLTRVTASVGAVERIWTPRGTFTARRIALTRRRLHHSPNNAYKALGDTEQIGTVWLTTTAPHLPVAMDFRAPVGMAKLRLSHHSSKDCR